MPIYPDGETTNATPTPPDVFYLRSREDLLQYEDARFNSLIQAVANYYLVENDQSIWGDFLRAYAQELARLDYDYSYDIVAKNPAFLTPPDIKRRFAASLYINRLYPTLDPVQYDLDYKAMLVALIPAYFMGATVASLEAIIKAYTGLTITVVELYKFIGQGFFDQSDRNAITVSVDVGGTNPLDDITQLNQLQAITNALYGAIDLGKPAHVGLEFKTVFATGENMDSFVTQGTSAFYNVVNPNGITDLLRIIVKIVEGQPLNPMLYQAPDLLVSSSRTGLGPSQVLAWTPRTSFVQGQMILAGVPGAGFFQVVTTAGTSGVVPPVFNPTLGGITLDGGVTWTNVGNATGVILYPVTEIHNPPPPPWLHNDVYSLTTTILDPNGFIQQVTTAGTSGNTIPAFNPVPGGITHDNGVVWTNIGVQNPLFATILDPNGFVQIVSQAGYSFPSWVQNTAYGIFGSPAEGQEILDANGFIQEVLVPGVSGKSSLSPLTLYYPPFVETPNATTPDGTVIWQTQSLFAWNKTLGGVTMDGTTIWVNIGRPPGLVAPRINQAWEIKSDSLTTFETS